MPDSYGITKKRLSLIEFATWPVEVRESYIKRELPDSPHFIKRRLLSVVSK